MTPTHRTVARMRRRPAAASGLLAGLLAAMLLLPVQALAQGTGLGAAGELVDPDVLRVCADPSNMPFTDKSGEGFENKLAELVAAETGRKSVAYTWFPSVIGFVRNTLGAHRCDVIMGYAQGGDAVQSTNAYYRSSYVLVYPKGSAVAGAETIEDPKLTGKRIGVVESTPPTVALPRDPRSRPKRKPLFCAVSWRFSSTTPASASIVMPSASGGCRRFSRSSDISIVSGVARVA